MGKPTGFIDYKRKNNNAVPVSERIKNFKEFHPPLVKEEREIQGARCMNCGVPFCQTAMKLGGMVTGCPLHNLIPEFNDEIFNDNWHQALARLKKTNNFPEFTGRVCPALCETACTCSLYGDAVTVKENELAIIENGYAEGFIKPQPPEIRTDKKIAVIGSGPSGLACADELNKRGHNVTVFEREDRIGGLLMYGIPNMKLDKSVIERRIKIMEDEGVVFKIGCNIGKDLSSEQILSDFDAVALCCGAKQPRGLNVPGNDAEGIYYAVDFLTDTTKDILEGKSAGSRVSAKNKNVVIVGGGDTGNDCVGTCVREGAKNITQIEMMPKAPEKRAADNPWPEWAKICKTDYGVEEANEVFKKDIRVYETTVKEIVKNTENKITAVKTVKLSRKTDEKTGRPIFEEVKGSEKELPCELLIICAGFTGAEKYVSEAFKTELSERNTVKADEISFKTNVSKVFAAGDIRRGQSLVVWAIAEGRACAKEIDKFVMGYTNL